MQEIDLEIRDLDESTTKEEVLEAIMKEMIVDYGITPDMVKSFRGKKAYGETQIATIRLAAETAKKAMEKEKIHMS